MELNTILFVCNWVKANYIGSNATVKRDEYGFTFVNFNSPIPISNQSFVFPIHVEQVLFSNDPKERGWKVVLCEDPYRRQVARGVEFDPQALYMLSIEIDNRYTSLQAPISFPKTTQISTIVGGVPLMLANLVDVTTNERDQDGDNDPHNVDAFIIGSSSFESNGDVPCCGHWCILV